MPLPAGTRLGPYEIISVLGVGGMGEVYRARDSKLNRDVALKVLPDYLANDPDRLARFRREAQVLASLNHPNIAAIYHIGDAPHPQSRVPNPDTIQYLVMELVEGADLSQRIASGAVPLDEALPIASQIAEALGAAHEHGIMHRDLKPANIRLREDGVVKVLDFGLAKAMEDPATAADLTQSPTLSLAATRAGVILGTAAYMSPEQAKGKPADKRADIWAFGCVLYELLTGRRAFIGDDVSDTLAAVLRGEPDWSALPRTVPPPVRAALKRCLHKNPKERLHDIADLRFLMEGAAEVAQPPSSVAARSRWRSAIQIGIAAIVFTAVGGLAVWNFTPSTPSPVMRSVFMLAEGQEFTNTGRHVVAISPDGMRMAYHANNRLFLRSMSELEAKPIQGTETHNGALNPVFSPDGESIAFWAEADATIKRIGVSGGVPVTVCQAARPFGLNWQGDVIVFGQGGAGIGRVPAGGGKSEVLVSVQDGETAHGPHILPDGRGVLFTLAQGTASDRWDKARIVVQPLPSGERKTLIEGGSDARYVSTGHLVYALGDVLFAAPFDLERLEIAGSAVPVVQSIRRASITEIQTGAAHFAFSDTGSLIYVPGLQSTETATRDLTLFDRKGNVEPLGLPPGSYATPRVSPDGKRVAYSTTVGNEQAIYVYEISGSSSARRLTFGGRSRYPVWSADGTRVAFQSDREGDLAIFWQRADGTGTAERLTKPESGSSHIPDSWSPKDDVLLFTVFKDSFHSSWTLSLRDKKTEPFAGVRQNGMPQAVFSPDGQWVAYRSSGPGTNAVFVQPFPATGAMYQIAAGDSPAWSSDGKEIYYRFSGNQLVAASTTMRPTVNVGGRTEVRTPPGFRLAGTTPRDFDITPDGRIIAAIVRQTGQAGTASTPRIHVVVNWTDELKRLAPARGR